MPEGLIIVESPAKAKTLKRFLGDRFDVRASMGHVRDLPEKEMGVEVDDGFKPHYEVVESRRKTINELKAAAKGEREVILASDPDREGEAIAWHLAEVLKLRDPKRIEFHEITSDAVRRALESPRVIDMRLVNAQQARRVVDRLVGFRLSPFLWAKVQKGIGAGRVSSVALRLVVDREDEIRKFVPVESWTIDVELAKTGAENHFLARLNRPLESAPGETETKFEIHNEAEAQDIVRRLEGATYRVIGVEQKRRTKSSNPPYITSTLQQDASSRLRMRPFATMRVAQQLYEGVELGAEGPTGLITYMRTDSTRISGDADSKVKGWIKQQHGEKYLGVSRAAKATPGAQDAHEAIRPTDVNRTPDSIREHLSADQYKLYDLIWRRFVASRMAPAVYDQTQVEIQGGSPAGGGHVFRANGSVLAFDGFYKVWGRDENGENELPFLAQGEDLDYHGLKPEQHFTQPPPRYTEATLIKELEQRGIGRPSTYAPIVQTITKAHGYVEIKDRRLYPTRVGEAVNTLMVDHFKSISDDQYTSQLEQRLDQVESGSQEWVPVVKDFYGPLQRMLSAAEEATPTDTDEVCPLCNEGHLVRKASRFGPFMGCSRYPKCKFRRALTPDGEPPQPKLLDEPCPTCGRPLQLRTGRYGEFVGCSGYPECKYIKRDASQAESKLTGEKCPQCGEGQLVERTGRYGPFVACSRYPDCNYRANIGKDGKPRQGPKVLDEPCPICGKPLVERRGRFGAFKSCSDYPKCPGPKGVTGRAQGARTGKKAKPAEEAVEA
ncbi:MAG: DNA topoisomerase I [Actinobacteria bacterium 13_1_40CM_2_66_13]|nr:MAG: DNA topoisomerase I [Chloroflexi bacterium 13_1_40CM_66_19]OLD06690.1 MAG: DNA topoisomerase I [Actinobacteria bacterium 13_1_40CM_3_66_19]OLD54299.1 MAG: DNA topoisomerase I [Actinobacteria bacterium 13_1_40CM_2_66_13]OLE72462.1 MAG: DNA topoisomerase I [Actinobacteria bacterium 13_1_20CM_2_66_18]TMF64900.1 MAG: type I DNA topoisomerase [Chloroflexota bacterium]